MAYIDKYGVEFSDDRKTLVCCSKDFQGEYVIPEGVTNIEGKAFYNCSNLISIKIPNSVTCIGKEAFWGCDCLTDIVFGNSVTRIEKHAFSYCRSLTSIEFPSSVTSIEDYAFSNCSSLTSISVAADNSTYSSEGGVLFNKDKTILIQYPGGKQGAYTIPNSVTDIGLGAFSGCGSLTTIEIPSSVTSIGNYAFVNCRNLKEIRVPKGQKERFAQMKGLKDYVDIIVECEHIV